MTWRHSSIAGLAKALGVSERSCELWRRSGAPLDQEPFDELAVRLWHAAGPGRRGRRAATLATPTDQTLAVYVQQIAALAAKPDEDAPDELDQIRLERERWELSLVKEKYKKSARSHFDRLFGALLRALDQETGSIFAGQIWELARGDRLACEGPIHRRIRQALDQALSQALGAHG